MVLQLAVNMMPNHQNYTSWMRKCLELMISAQATPSDLTNATVLNGKAVSAWVNGSNLNSDFTMINHNRFQPDYQSTVSQSTNSALLFTLAGKPMPEAAFFRANDSHSGLVSKNFVSGTTPYVVGGPIQTPGGTVFTPSTTDIYYPQGNDWGSGRRMNFAHFDIIVRAFGLDNLVTNKGAYWEPYHAQKVLDMQNRFTDGHTYANTTEDNFASREEAVAQHAARGFLTKWIVKQGTFAKTIADFARFKVLDNGDSGVTTTGAWTTSTLSGYRIGADYLSDGNTGKGTKSVTYTPTLTGGLYKVYMYWNSATTRATNVPITITHATGTTQVTMDQTLKNGVWVQVGSTFTFNPGSSGSVSIGNAGTNGFVIADAARFDAQ